jgi:hypothetical protein
MAGVVLIAGFVLTRRVGTHDLGVICIGWAFGVGVASALLAIGVDPKRGP